MLYLSHLPCTDLLYYSTYLFYCQMNGAWFLYCSSMAHVKCFVILQPARRTPWCNLILFHRRSSLTYVHYSLVVFHIFIAYPAVLCTVLNGERYLYSI